MDPQIQQKRIKTFETGVNAYKFGLVALLTGLSLKHGDVSFISKHPSKFLTECIMMGATSTIPVAIMAYTRKHHKEKIKHSQVLNAMFIAFMIFFIFHLLLELSGLNNIEPQDEKQQAFLKKYITNTGMKVGIVLLGALLTGLAIRTHDMSLFNENRIWIALSEIAFMTFANTIPCYQILKNRGNKEGTIGKALMMGGAFTVACMALETGGIFGCLFNPKEKAIRY